MAYSNNVSSQQRDGSFFAKYLQDLVKYKHLLANIVASDLRSRFRRSRLGVLWAVIQPMTYAFIIAFVWKSVFGSQSYWEFALYLYSGLIVWDFFGAVMTVSLNTLAGSAGLIKQARIPLLIFQVRVPITSMIVSLLGLVGLVVMQSVLGELSAFGPHLLLVPVFYIILILFGIPLSIIMSLLGAKFRDVQYITPLLVQGLFFLSPVMIHRELFSRPELAFLQYVNPLAPMLYIFRDPIIYGNYWNPLDVGIVLAWTAALWILAIIFSSIVGRRVVFLL